MHSWETLKPGDEMMSEAMRHIHRAWRDPTLPLLQFVPVAVEQGLEAGLDEAGLDETGLAPGPC